MAKKLTRNQQYVLYGLTKYPLLNDRELAKHIDVEKSTIAKARKVLFDRKYFRTVRMPLFSSLGCELFSILYTGYSSPLLTKQNIDKFMKENRKFPESFLSVVDRHQAFSFYVSRNYTTIKEIFSRYEELAAQSGSFRREDVSYVSFSFVRAIFLKLFDFSSLLNNEFELGFPEEKKTLLPTPAGAVKEKKLSRSEKTVLYALVRHPDDTDTAISSKFNVSRQLISRCRTDFENKLMRTLRAVDLSKIGFNLMTLSHIQLEPHLPEKELKSDYEKLLNNPHLIFGITEDNETIFIEAFKSEEDIYKQDTVKILSKYREKNYVVKEPRTLFMDLRTQKMPINFEFHKILDVLYGKDIKAKA